MKSPYNYSSVSNLAIILSFKKDNKKKFKCPRHGWIKGWIYLRKFRKRRNIYKTDHRILKRLDKKKIKLRKTSGYYDYYIKCPKCSSEYEKQLYKSQPIKAVLRYSKKHAHNKKMIWDLSEDIILEKIEKQKNRCFYTKILFNKSNNFLSIDRINSNKGYIKSNINLVIEDVNLMKQDLSHNDFIKLCKRINNPKITKGSLKLLKYAYKIKSKKEIEKDKQDYLNGKKVLCYVHGFHRDYIDSRPAQKQEKTSRKLRFQCSKCYFSRKITYSMKDPKRYEEDVKRYKSGKKVFCKKHGYHKHYSFYYSKIRKRSHLRCHYCYNETYKKYRDSHIFSIMYTHAGTRRVNRVLEYSDLIKLYIKQEGKCALSGIVFDQYKNKPSMDRIDSNKGYIKNNLHLVTYLVNRTKWDLSLKNFKKYVKKISQYH